MTGKYLLSDVKVRSLKPKEKLYRVADGNRLYLAIAPNGSRFWQYRYIYNGKEQILSLGVYPEVTIAEARAMHATAKEQLINGICPASAKKAAVLETRMSQTTFTDVAENYIQYRKNLIEKGILKGKEDHFGRLKLHILDVFGSVPIEDITSKQVLDTLLHIQDGGREATAEKLRTIIRLVFQHGIIRMNLNIKNPVDDLRHINELKRKIPAKNHRHCETPKQLSTVLLALEQGRFGTITQRAAWLAPRVFLRSSELVGALWEEINIKDAVWRINGNRMKTGKKHIVPLSDQVIQFFEDLRELTGENSFCFASIRTSGQWSGTIRPESIRKTLIDLGFGKEAIGGGVTTHGFRHAASTFLRELGYDPRFIELQLAHQERSKVVASYNFADFLPARREMMQAWSDYLDKLRDEAAIDAEIKELILK
jgi:integrase